jgi:hypothetical protein
MPDLDPYDMGFEGDTDDIDLFGPRYFLGQCPGRGLQYGRESVEMAADGENEEL